MKEKEITPMGLTNKRWSEFEELLARANKEQIKQMILRAGLKLKNYRVDLVEQDEN